LRIQAPQCFGSRFLGEGLRKRNAIELGRHSLDVEQQVPIKVNYEGEIVGDFCADLWAESRIIVELKAVQSLLKEQEVQLVNYLTATKTETAY
jgi:GxxExxY protein